MDCGKKYTVEPKFEYCSKEEFIEFLKSYPNPLNRDYYMDAFSYNDFKIADKWPDSIVAMMYPAYYPEKGESDEYRIAVNMKEVFESIKEEK